MLVAYSQIRFGFEKKNVVSMDSSVGRVAASVNASLFSIMLGSNPINAFFAFFSFLLYDIFICIIHHV